MISSNIIYSHIYTHHVNPYGGHFIIDVKMFIELFCKTSGKSCRCLIKIICLAFKTNFTTFRTYLFTLKLIMQILIILKTVVDEIKNKISINVAT